MTERPVGPRPTRRRLLGAAGGTLAALSASGWGSAGRSDVAHQETETSTPEPPGAVWPLFQFDGDNSGYWPDGTGPQGEAGARWGHLEGGEYVATPVVSEEEVFVADAGAGVVRSVSRRDGTENWRRDLEIPHGQLSLRDRTLYVPTRDLGAQLQALNAGSGDERWSAGLGSAAMATVPAGNYVFVASLDGIYKVSTISEDISWHYDGVTVRDASIAVTDDAVYAAGTRYGKVVKVNRASGSEAWSKNLDATPGGEPTVEGEHIVVPFDDGVVSFRKDSGRERWRYDASVDGSVAAADGNVYGTTTGGEVFALDLASGEERWRTAAVEGSTPPVVVGALLYAVGTGGTVAALNPANGTVLWSTNVGAEVAANPAVAGTELYLGDRSGRLAALAQGTSGGYGEPTPTDTETPTGTGTRTATDSPTATRTGSDPTSTGVDLTDPSPDTTATPDPRTDTPGDGDEGGLDLPLIGGGVAAVVALLGGGLWWRNQQKDEYDPLG